jgi:glutamyl-tRNA reductase
MESMIPHSYNLLMVGINYRTAPIDLREKFAAGTQQTRQILGRLRTDFPHAEFMLLSTCNRVELYSAAPVGKGISDQALVDQLAAIGDVPAETLTPHVYTRQNIEMVEQLFRVASSLDSMVLGETQILGQVRDAYQIACQMDSVGTMLHAVCQRALAAGKDIHENTRLSEGRTSVAGVAVELIGEVFDSLVDKTVLVIGAGKMAAIMLKHIMSQQPRRLLVSNRDSQRGLSLAQQCGADRVDFSRLDDGLVLADVVLTGTSAREPIITSARLKNLLRARQYRPLFIIDVAVPRDVEEDVSKLPNTFLYNVDDLNQISSQTRLQRGGELEKSNQIIRRHVEEFIAWLSARNSGPIVKALYQQCREISDRELIQVFADHPELTAQQQEAIKKFAHRLVGKILHTPVTQLGNHAVVDRRLQLATAVKELFRLTDEAAKAADNNESGNA